MGLIINIIIIWLLAAGMIVGAKQGLIKSLVNLIGVIAIVILSYSLREPLVDFLVDKMPFYNFGGLTSLSILVYNALAFLIIFTVLMCILKIILAVTNVIDTLLKMTVIWVIPSKIGGAIIGFLETWVLIHIALFVMMQFNGSYALIKDSSLANTVLDHTPIVGTYLSSARDGAREIYDGVDELLNDKSKSEKDINLFILKTEIKYNLITKEKANELIERGKFELDNVVFGKGVEPWLSV